MKRPKSHMLSVTVQSALSQFVPNEDINLQKLEIKIILIISKKGGKSSKTAGLCSFYQTLFKQEY